MTRGHAVSKKSKSNQKATTRISTIANVFPDCLGEVRHTAMIPPTSPIIAGEHSPRRVSNSASTTKTSDVNELVLLLALPVESVEFVFRRSLSLKNGRKVADEIQRTVFERLSSSSRPAVCSGFGNNRVERSHPGADLINQIDQIDHDL